MFIQMRAPLKTLFLGTVVIGWLLAAVAWPQNADSAGLESVLSQMDAAGKKFHTTEASFVWDHYFAVIKEIDESARQKGTIYFQRESDEVQMAADIVTPDNETILYSGGKVQWYKAKTDEVNVFTPGKNRSDIEGYLVLGFGGGGHDLLKSYDVKLLGSETIDGSKVTKLELIPKSEHFRDKIARIWLWIDPLRGISLQQQFFEPSPGGDFRLADYRLAKYSGIKINAKLPDNVFKLKTTRKTKFVPPPG
jgi:outer membrane lipoprotein-sorting protein